MHIMLTNEALVIILAVVAMENMGLSVFIHPIFKQLQKT